jgi:transposase
VFGNQITRILAYREAVDMRKSFTGLQGLVAGELEEDPLSGTLYVFVNRRRNLLKALFWDRTGYVLLAKRLERGRFSFPREDRVQALSRQIFLLFLDGITLGAR